MGLPSDTVHEQEVANIAARVRQFHDSKLPFRVYHGSTNSTRASERRLNNIVDISRLNRVIAINTSSKERIAFVEPNVPMDKLVAETLKLGLMPPVVMEFPGITAGGGFAGTSGESSSFRHSVFDRTVRSIQIVLGNGEVRFASADDPTSSELFWAAAGSFGTIGLVTLLAVELIDAMPFVELAYVKISSMEHAVSRFKEEQENMSLDYMDGVMFAENSGVLCLGKLVRALPPQATKLTTFSKPTDDWFYINAEQMLADPNRSTWTEYVPIQDYLFRYERGAFWISKYTFRYFSVPLNRFTRWLLDTYTHTRIMYSALHHSGLSSKYIIQDVSVPYDSAPKLLSYLNDNFRQYPLWLCPIRLRGTHPSSAHGLLAETPATQLEGKDLSNISSPLPEMMLNFGVWGPGPSDPQQSIAWNKAFEAKIRELRGQKWLYAQTYYTADEFWESYSDREHYSTLRQKYFATTLPSIYEKVRHKGGDSAGQDDFDSWWTWLYVMFWNIWPLASLYGWLMCILNGKYLLPERKFWTFGQDPVSKASNMGSHLLESEGLLAGDVEK